MPKNKKEAGGEDQGVYGRSDLGYWQEMAVAIAEELIPMQEADYFVPYVNFVRTAVGRSRLHEVGHVTDHIMKAAEWNDKIQNVYVIGPRKMDIPRVVDALGAAEDGSEVRIIFPEGQDVDLTRATAIVAVTQRIPFQCLPYIKSTSFSKIQGEEGKYLHFLECTIGKGLR